MTRERLARGMKTWAEFKEQFYLQKNLRKFFKCHGYHVDLENPRTYNEKIIWRKVFDRNPEFPLLTDKYRSREYVIKSMGREAAEKLLVPILFVTDHPDDIPFGDLPEEYIVKPNHGSGWSIIVDQEHRVSRKKIVSESRKWLNRIYGQSKMEWAYSQVKPLIMIEKLLKDGMGKLAPDFKFYVFNGTVKMIYVMHDRFGSPSEAFYDRDFRRLWINSRYEGGPEIRKPEGFGRMVEISEKLAAPFDFLRVDLYHVEGNIFFGEFTLYPASGLYRYEPVEFERSLGECWDLDRVHMRKFKPLF